MNDAYDNAKDDKAILDKVNKEAERLSQPVTPEWVADKMKDYERRIDVVEFDMQRYTIENVGYAIVKALDSTGDTFASVIGVSATRDVITVLIEYHKLKAK